MTAPSPYAAVALDREAAELAALQDGRKVGVHRAAVKIGGLVGAGALAHEEAEVRLLDAAVANGTPESVARSAVRRGLRWGEAHPREVPTDNRAGGRWTAKPPTRSAPLRPPPEEAPRFPPSAEVAALWAACRPIHEDDEVATWLRDVRGLDVDAVALEVGPRALPRRAEVPTWARCRGRAWTASGHRCMFPVFDATGAHVAVRARAVVPLAEGEEKSLAPAGFPVRGGVLADHLGRRLLAGERPECWTGVVVVAEGEPDFCAFATNRSDAEESTYAVLGIGAGFWTKALGARIPDGATVIVSTHADEAGHRYAAMVEATLRGRCDVRRGLVP